MTSEFQLNRRQSLRVAANLVVKVQPVSSHREPLGPQLAAVTIVADFASEDSTPLDRSMASIYGTLLA